jgi:NDP-sugar pyrophosphorylase family protein
VNGQRSRAIEGGAAGAPLRPAGVKAMIMAAGLGTRLYPLTGRTAKPMVPILNRPVMEHMIKLLRRHGITEVAANLHYHPDKIRRYFGDGSDLGVELRYNFEEKLLGTAGGVGEFRHFFGDDTFVVVSGDGLTDIDLTRLVAAHRAAGGAATMAVKQVEDPSMYGVVVADEDRRVRGFQEKPPREQAQSHLCNCGIYAFEPAIFDHVPPGEFCDWAKDVFPALLRDDVPFHVWQMDGYWNDVGNIEQYRSSNFDALLGNVVLDIPGRQIKPGVWIGEGTQIESEVRLEPPILIGAGCLIEADAELVGPLIIGDGCVIERGALLEGVIHWDGVKAGRNSHVAGSILGRHVVIHHEAAVHQDAVIGDRSEVCAFATVRPMARVEPRSRVGLDGVPEPDPSL